MADKILLIDGSSIVETAYYHVPEMKNEEGQNQNAVYGFLNLLKYTVDKYHPEYLGITWDEISSLTRPEPADLHQQRDILKNRLKAMGITLLEKEGYKKSDILDQTKNSLANENIEILILSNDKDCFQFVSDFVKVCFLQTTEGNTSIKIPSLDEIKKLTRNFEFSSIEKHEFTQHLEEMSISKVKFDSDEVHTDMLEDGFLKVTDLKTAKEILANAKYAQSVSATTFKNTADVLPLFASMAEIGGIGISYEKNQAYAIYVGEEIDEHWLMRELEDVSQHAKEFFMFDIKAKLKELPNLCQTSCFDGVIAAYLLNPLKNDYTAEDILKEYLDLVVDSEIDEYKKICYEVYAGLQLIDIFQEKLNETNMWDLFSEIEMPLVFTLYAMERNGVRVDAKALKDYGDSLAVRIFELEAKIHELAGETFNINSPKQLGIILFEKMELPGGKKTKTGYSTAADVLEKLASEHEIVSLILEYRQLAKLKSTYADGLAHFIGNDERIHGKFNQTITATGRISSAEPNLQNIPIRMELGRLIRKVFVPEEGYVFVDADYSQIELRILAHCSGDKQLIEAYREAKDIHRITASQVFHIPFDEVTELQRRNAKAVNFGIVYGISSFGLSQDLSIGRKEAEHYIEEYFKTYPGIKIFLDEMVDSAKEKGYVATIFGRRRPVPELKSSKFMQRSFGERVAMNAPIQGAAADIMKIAMIGVQKSLEERKMKSRLVLQVHDELLIEAHQSEVEEVKQLLREEMEQAASLLVPLEIDMNVGTNWYEAK